MTYVVSSNKSCSISISQLHFIYFLTVNDRLLVFFLFVKLFRKYETHVLSFTLLRIGFVEVVSLSCQCYMKGSDPDPRTKQYIQYNGSATLHEAENICVGKKCVLKTRQVYSIQQYNENPFRSVLDLYLVNKVILYMQADKCRLLGLRLIGLRPKLECWLRLFLRATEQQLYTCTVHCKYMNHATVQLYG